MNTQSSDVEGTYKKLDLDNKQKDQHVICETRKK